MHLLDEARDVEILSATSETVAVEHRLQYALADQWRDQGAGVQMQGHGNLLDDRAEPGENLARGAHGGINAGFRRGQPEFVRV